MRFRRGHIQRSRRLRRAAWAAAGVTSAALLILPLATEVQGSPPGRNGRIVIAGGTSSRQDLRSILPDGTRPRRLTSTRSSDESAPRWSPDGARIVFTGTTGDTFDTELFLISSDGSRRRRLTDNHALDTSPDWSPMGQRIVFIRGRHSRSLYTMRSDGSHVRRIDYNGYVGYWVRWSPSGSRIAFEGSGDIFSIRLDGTGKRRITADITRKRRGSDGDRFGGIDGLDWSPDGKRILVSAHKGEAEPYVYSVRRSGGSERRVTKGRAGVWSPNGQAIAFVRGNRRVMVNNLERGTTRLIATARQLVSSVAWQPR